MTQINIIRIIGQDIFRCFVAKYVNYFKVNGFIIDLYT